MCSKRWLGCLAAVAAILALSASTRGDVISHGGTTVTLDFVSIGNAGNAADTHNVGFPGTLYCGSVGYEYHIGTYEVSADQWAAVNAAAGIGDAGVWAGDQPVGNISWSNAAMFCNWLTSGDATVGYYVITGSGDSALASVNVLSHDAYAAAHGSTFFIPTEDEWYKAAYYDPVSASYYDYPTSSDSAPTDVLSGTASGTAVWDGTHVTPTAPADVFSSGGLSPYLTMGQAGNVWEWNETVVSGMRGRRGAAYDSSTATLMAASNRGFANPLLEWDDTGFRVAAIIVPEPGSLGLLLLGVAGVAARRRRAGR